MDQVRAKRLVAELKGQSVGDWLVGDYIGNGASAVVATATRGDQEAALKLIDPEMVERYGANQQLQRVKLQRSLRDHNQPNIVKIFDGGCCAQTKYLYLVMQKLTLPTLTSVVPDFPRHRIGVIIEQLAKAARYLECRSIVHRDIKPDNILITPDFTKAFLLDLGVVRFVAGEERSDGGTADEFLGTTRYSPPEFVARDEEDSTDGWRAVTFYQLGAVLHDMIMCRRLFDEINGPPAKLIDAVRTMQPVIEAGDVPSHLLSLARFCLQKHWRHRLELLRWDDFSSVPPIAVSGQQKIESSGAWNGKEMTKMRLERNLSKFERQNGENCLRKQGDVSLVPFAKHVFKAAFFLPWRFLTSQKKGCSESVFVLGHPRGTI